MSVTKIVSKTARLRQIGIAFSGAVGAGLFLSSGQIIAMGGPGGALLAFLFAGLIIFAVMNTLAEMVSVRPVSGAIMDFPDVFVDEALGFAVGLMYWWEPPGLAHLSESLLIGENRLANCMSMVTLTIAAAMCTQYWGSGFGIGYVFSDSISPLLYHILNL